jgi:hypothetical protein
VAAVEISVDQVGVTTADWGRESFGSDDDNREPPDQAG